MKNSKAIKAKEIYNILYHLEYKQKKKIKNYYQI